MRELRAQGLDPLAAAAGDVVGLGPRAVARVVVARVRRLAPEALSLARAAAVLGEGADRRLVARLARVRDGVAAPTLDALEAVGVIS